MAVLVAVQARLVLRGNPSYSSAGVLCQKPSRYVHGRIQRQYACLLLPGSVAGDMSSSFLLPPGLSAVWCCAVEGGCLSFN